MTQYSHHEIYGGGESRWETNSSFPSWLSRFPPAAHRSVSHKASGRDTQTHRNNVKEWRYVCLCYGFSSDSWSQLSENQEFRLLRLDAARLTFRGKLRWAETESGRQLENPRRRTKTTTAFPNTCSGCRARGQCMIFVTAQIFTVWMNILLQDTNCYRVCTTWIYFPCK